MTSSLANFNDSESHPINILEELIISKNWVFERPIDDEIYIEVPTKYSNLIIQVTWLKNQSRIEIRTFFYNKMDFSNNKEALWDGCNSRDFFQPIVGYIADIEKTKYGGHSKYYINGILDVNKDGKDDLFITEYGKLMNTNFFLFSKGDGTFFRNNNIIIY